MDDRDALSSIAGWIDAVRAGEPLGQQALWDRFFPQIVRLAKSRMRDGICRAGDEEDVALSVLNSFFAGFQENSFPDVRGRDDLWRLLSRMTQRKVADWVRSQGRKKRFALGESALMRNAFDENPLPMEQQKHPGPTPDMELVFIEQCQRLMKLLPTDLQAVVIQKLSGQKNEDIANQLNCSIATVERRLKLIRELWTKAIEDERGLEP